MSRTCLTRAKILCATDTPSPNLLLLYTSWVANELKQFERNVITTLYLHPESNRDALQQGIFLPHYVTIAKQCLLWSGLYLYHIEILASKCSVRLELSAFYSMSLNFNLGISYILSTHLSSTSSYSLGYLDPNLARYYPYTLLVSAC